MLSNKKRSMAIVMAGATVMSAAAPIFADNTVTENVDKNYTVSAKDSAKLIEEVRKALEVKFEDGEKWGIVDGYVVEREQYCLYPVSKEWCITEEQLSLV